MPSKKHEDAVVITEEALMIEFGIGRDDIERGKSSFPMRLRPDICFFKPGTNNFLVVEVGTTNAEKINKYRQSKRVDEIRWYTKLNDGIYLVGQWDLKHAPIVKVDSKTCSAHQMDRSLKNRHEELKSELKRRGISIQTIVCCSGCGYPVKIEELKTGYLRGEFYGVCYSCKDKQQFNTLGEIRRAVCGINVQAA